MDGTARSASEAGGMSDAAQLVAQTLRKPALAPVSIAVLAACLDILTVAHALWFADFLVAGPALAWPASAAAALAAGLLAAAALAWSRRYRLRALRRTLHGGLSVYAVALAFAAVAALTGLWSAPAPAFMLAAAGLLPAAILPGRLLVASIARWALDYGLTERRAVIVGGGAPAADLIRGLSANPDNDIRICAIFDDRTDSRSPPVVIGVPRIGNVADLVHFARTAEIDMLIVTLPLEAERRIREILGQVEVLPMDVRLSAYASDYSFRRRAGASGLIGVRDNPLDARKRLVKRAMDVVLASLALLVLSPVMLGVALAVRLSSPGPIFFRQQRFGYNHKPVDVLKFRSMYTHQCDPTARNVVIRDDPRVTPVGRFIRKYSLDELPQLFNVLGGSLSLVGPRPHVVAAVSTHHEDFEELVENYAARHRVPPGVTGWAQINGWRGEIDDPAKLRARIEHDLYYIENRSIWLDLYILAVTPFRLFDTGNAY